MSRLRCDHAPAWAQLQAHYAASGQAFDTREAFAQDAQRFAHFSQAAPHVFVDLSKNRIDAATEALRSRARSGIKIGRIEDVTPIVSAGRRARRGARARTRRRPSRTVGSSLTRRAPRPCFRLPLALAAHRLDAQVPRPPRSPPVSAARPPSVLPS